MNKRSIERVLMAADLCTPDSHRESAIIGGIAKCLITRNHFLPSVVAEIAVEQMAWFAHDFPEQALHYLPNRSKPTPKEIEVACRKFMAQYDPPGEKVAA